jgi:DNA polymerase-4
MALKAAVREATGLNCSIGITPNKLLSKIASELDKPDGLTLLDHADIPARIWPLAARKVNGIGPKAAAKLSALGIETIGDVAAAEPAFLIEHFGKSFGAWMHAAAHGRDERPVVTASEPESISRETTFDRDLHAVRDRDELGAIFTDCARSSPATCRARATRRRPSASSCASTTSGSPPAPSPCPRTPSTAARSGARAGQCLKRVDLGRRLRLLGVRASALRKVSELRSAYAATHPAPRCGRGDRSVRVRPRAPSCFGRRGGVRAGT